MFSLNFGTHGQSSPQRIGDFGDAPHNLPAAYLSVNPSLLAGFPSRFSDAVSDYVYHRNPQEAASLGFTVTTESDARMTNQDVDDGWLPHSFGTCQMTTIEIQITMPESASEQPIYFNLLADWNHNGRWGDVDACTESGIQTSVPEWAIQNLRLDQAPFRLQPGFRETIQLPRFVSGSTSGELWLRFTISDTPAYGASGQHWRGHGQFIYGETEDYFSCVLITNQPLTNCPEQNAFPLTDTSPERTFSERSDVEVLEFVQTHRNALDQFWTDTFTGIEQDFSAPTELTAYENSIQTRCGEIQPNNAFFCIWTHSIYYDLQFLSDIWNTQGAGAAALIIAHEWGHVVQSQLNLLSGVAIQNELQADCFAGVYAHYALSIGLFDQSNIEQANSLFDQIGDDLPWYDPGAHGTSEQRRNAFEKGFEFGMERCIVVF